MEGRQEEGRAKHQEEEQVSRLVQVGMVASEASHGHHLEEGAFREEIGREQRRAYREMGEDHLI